MEILRCHQQCADLQQVLLFASLINVGSVRQFFYYYWWIICYFIEGTDQVPKMCWLESATGSQTGRFTCVQISYLSFLWTFFLVFYTSYTWNKESHHLTSHCSFTSLWKKYFTTNSFQSQGNNRTKSTRKFSLL